jgi:hypothetical protein
MVAEDEHPHMRRIGLEDAVHGDPQAVVSPDANLLGAAEP